MNSGENYRNFIKKHKYIIIILIFALSLRIWGITHGLPIIHNPDEDIMQVAATQLSFNDLNPGNFEHPSFMYYTGFIIHKFVYSTLNIDPTLKWEYILGRLLFGTLLGTLTVLFLYLSARLMYNETTALLAALFMSVVPFHIMNSHFFYLDIPLTFFITVSLYFAVKAYKSNTSRYFFFSAIAAGFAAGTKYTGGAAIIITLSALVAKNIKHGKGSINIKNCKSFLYILLFFCMAFIITTPMIVLDYNTFKETGFLYQIDHVTKLFDGNTGVKGHAGFDLSPEGFPYSRFLFQIVAAFPYGLGIPLYVLSLFGLVYIIKKHEERDIIPLTFFCGFFIMISSLYVVFTRYYLPLFPFFVLFASVLCADILIKERYKKYKKAMMIIIVVTILYSLAMGISLTDNLIHNTREEASQWVNENIPVGSNIVRSRYAPNIDPSKFNVYRIENLPKSFVPDFIIIDETMYARFYKEPEKHIKEKTGYVVYNAIREHKTNLNSEIIKTIKKKYFNEWIYKKLDPMFYPIFTSPDIEIYEIKKDKSITT
jgi:hypothetical protein